jgi:hypothetical protein
MVYQIMQPKSKFYNPCSIFYNVLNQNFQSNFLYIKLPYINYDRLDGLFIAKPLRHSRPSPPSPRAPGRLYVLKKRKQRASIAQFKMRRERQQRTNAPRRRGCQ